MPSPSAAEIMTTNLVLGSPEMTLEEAIKILFSERITGLPVVDADKKMVGVVTEYDVIRQVRGKPGVLSLKRRIRYTKKVTSVSVDASFEEILKIFVERKVRRLPVLDKKGRLAGVISRHDIMRILFYRSKPL
jgi:CBS domain-containing protein